MTQIFNLPAPVNAMLPFIVARLSDGDFWYWGSWDNKTEAAHAACEIGGTVFHKSEICA